MSYNYSSKVNDNNDWLSSLNESERREVVQLAKNLSKPSNFVGLNSLTINWLVIATSIYIFESININWLYPLVVVVIGSRQHALLVLMHEASHHRLFCSRIWNDVFANWFCAWPLFVSLENYRRDHLAHHSHLNTDRDPDFIRKHGKKEWTFPKTTRELFILLSSQLAGAGLLYSIKRLVSLNTGKSSRKKVGNVKTRRAFRCIFYLFIILFLSLTDSWMSYLIFWIIPFATVTPFLLRVRSIAEHFGVSGFTELSMSRHVEPKLIERLLIAPHNINCHTAHHLFPSVPFSKLGILHQKLMQIESYRDLAHVSSGYFLGNRSVMSDLRNEMRAINQHKNTN